MFVQLEQIHCWSKITVVCCFIFLPLIQCKDDILDFAILSYIICTDKLTTDTYVTTREKLPLLIFLPLTRCKDDISDFAILSYIIFVRTN